MSDDVIQVRMFVIAMTEKGIFVSDYDDSENDGIWLPKKFLTFIDPNPPEKKEWATFNIEKWLAIREGIK
jgi:hypothetical protein